MGGGVRLGCLHVHRLPWVQRAGPQRGNLPHHDRGGGAWLASVTRGRFQKGRHVHTVQFRYGSPPHPTRSVAPNTRIALFSRGRASLRFGLTNRIGPPATLTFLASAILLRMLCGKAFQAVCRTEVEPDGLIFDEETMTIEEIRVGQEYDGQRIKLTAHLAQARIPLQIDVGFGDVVTPEAQTLDYARLLDTLPAPHIRAYTRETVIAEKLQAMVALDTLNTRMKDFYDICALANEFDYDGQTLCKAIQATFQRRKTPLSPQNCQRAFCLPLRRT